MNDNTLQSTVPFDSDTVQEQTGQRTLEVWNALGKILHHNDWNVDARSEFIISWYRQAAARIDALPRADVSQNAVQCLTEVATAFRRMADVIESCRKPALLINWLRGGAAEKLVSDDECRSAQAAMSAQIERIEKVLKTEQARLAAQHGLDFPLISCLVGPGQLTERDALLKRAMCLANEGNHQAAIEILTEVIRQYPDCAMAYQSRGHSENILGRPAMAFVDWTEAIRLAPSAPATYYARGALRLTVERWSEAIADYSKVIELDPSHVEAYRGRALAYRRLGKDAEALPDLTKVIELDPGDKDAYESRSSLYQRLGKEAEALRDHAKAEELRKKADSAPSAPKGAKNGAKPPPGQDPFAPPAVPPKPLPPEQDPFAPPVVSPKPASTDSLGSAPPATEQSKASK